MVSVGDPIGRGSSQVWHNGRQYHRPQHHRVDVSAKLVELFVELIPGLKLVGVCAIQQSDRDRVTSGDEDAVRKLNMQVRVVDARSSDEFERAFARLGAQRVNGVC